MFLDYYKYVFGVVGASTEEELLLAVGQEVRKLSNEHGDDIEVVSVSHCVERSSEAPLWTAFLTCLVPKNDNATSSDLD
jgi:hypothetical protein